MEDTMTGIALPVKQIDKRTLLRSLAPLMLGMLVGCGARDTEAQADGQRESDLVAHPNVRIINVEVTEVGLGDFTDYIRVIGQTEALFDVVVSAEETGAVREIVIPKGSFVNEGDTIIRLDNSILLALMEELVASANLAREQFERRRQLWEVDSLGSEISYLQAKYRSEIADARVLQMQTRLEGTIIYAPVSGVFDEQFVELGEMASVGTPVVRVVSVSRLKIVAGVPERYARFVHVGDRARVKFEIFPEETHFGRISYVGASVNEFNRTFPIEVVMDNPRGIIKPHMVADIQMTRQNLTGVVTVAQEVVIRTATGYKVFVVHEENGDFFSHARPVTLGDSYDNQVVIEDGLEVGDVLVTLGAQLVDDGSRINIVTRRRRPGGSG